MSSLAQLLARHAGVLILDATSTRVQVGLVRTGAGAVWRSSEDEAGRALFVLTSEVLEAAGWTLAEVPAFAFGAGPGSLLGVRTTAMALRTWLVLNPRPVHAFRSLELLAHDVALTPGLRPARVIADARRGSWHAVDIDAAGGVAPLIRVSQADLAAGTAGLFLPTEFRRWAEPPRPATSLSYDLPGLFGRNADRDLFASVDQPDAFAHEAPGYRRWTAQVHRAPGTPA